jgi:NarL family two-component system response regulator LiaR
VALLAAKHDLHVVGEAVDGHAAVLMAKIHAPDVILMDLEMPRQDGISAIKEIRQKTLKTKILVITSYTDEEHVIAAIRAGANGYLLKTTVPDDLVRAIHDVMADRRPLDPAITGTVIRELERPREIEKPWPDNLTNREVDIIKLVAKGYGNRQIGRELSISERTASTHASRILAKLQLENRTQIALYALRSGLVDLDDA